MFDWKMASSLTLLVGEQEGYQAHKNFGCKGFVSGSLWRPGLIQNGCGKVGLYNRD